MHIRDYLNKAATHFATREALVCQDTRLSAGQLIERIYRLSNALLHLGLRKGERVAVLLNNCHQSAECFYGICSAGLVLVPMNARNSLQEHLYVLNDSEPRAILVGAEFAEDIAKIMPEVPGLSFSLVVTGCPPTGMLDYEEMLAKAAPEEPQVTLCDEDLFSLRYTSGTTGRPKGVIHDHKANIATLHNTLLSGFSIEVGDTVALVGPVTHASGSMILPHIVCGGRIIILPRFQPKELLECIERERVNTLYLVPTILVILLAEPDIDQYDLSSLTTIRYGASPVSPKVLERAIERFGDVFVQGYGLTEGMMPVTILTKQDHMLDGSETRRKRLSSVGRETMTTQVRIMDEEGNFLPSGEIGEIVVASDQNMKGYWKNQEATQAAFRGAWLRTRDMGFRDEQGYVFVVDRKDHMIISGGFNVYPREVEDVLCRHPAILEAAVLGIPDDVWGEAVHASVSLKEGMEATAEEIIQHCREHLASYKKPKSVAFVVKLPKNAHGKIQKEQLKAPYWTGRSKRINSS